MVVDKAKRIKGRECRRYKRICKAVNTVDKIDYSLLEIAINKIRKVFVPKKKKIKLKIITNFKYAREQFGKLALVAAAASKMIVKLGVELKRKQWINLRRLEYQFLAQRIARARLNRKRTVRKIWMRRNG